MSVRRLLVEIDLEGLNVTEFCRRHGVSTWFFYQLRKRYAAEGEAALEARSRAAKTVANRTPDWVEDVIVDLRKELQDRGLDAGAATIWCHLPDRLPAGTVIPAEATIWRILSRRGFIIPQPKKAPPPAPRSFAAGRANECWQLDDIEWELADSSMVHIITLLDDCTRLCPRLQAVEAVNGETAFEAFSAAAGRWGWPERFLSDNASAYRHTLAAAVGALGVDHRHGRPHHPQTQGKIERFHQTLQKWLRAQPRGGSPEGLQAQLDLFTEIYNHQRPHRALGRKTPASVYEQTPKAGPADRAIGTPTSIHRVTVTGGTCHINKRYSVSIGAIYDHQQATVIITGLACHVFIAGRLVRHLQLDPGRRHQPLYDRPGRP